MTPAEVADQITECLTDVTKIAAKRYPNNATARRVDEVAQLRLLAETAAEHLHQFDRERLQYLGEIGELRAKIPPHPACLDGDLTDAQRVTRLLGKLKRLTVQRDKLLVQRTELRGKLFDQTLAEAKSRLARMSSGGVR